MRIRILLSLAASMAFAENSGTSRPFTVEKGEGTAFVVHSPDDIKYEPQIVKGKLFWMRCGDGKCAAISAEQLRIKGQDKDFFQFLDSGVAETELKAFISNPPPPKKSEAAPAPTNTKRKSSDVGAHWILKNGAVEVPEYGEVSRSTYENSELRTRIDSGKATVVFIKGAACPPGTFCHSSHNILGTISQKLGDEVAIYGIGGELYRTHPIYVASKHAGKVENMLALYVNGRQIEIEEPVLPVLGYGSTDKASAEIKRIGFIKEADEYVRLRDEWWQLHEKGWPRGSTLGAADKARYDELTNRINAIMDQYFTAKLLEELKKHNATSSSSVSSATHK